MGAEHKAFLSGILAKMTGHYPVKGREFFNEDEQNEIIRMIRQQRDLKLGHAGRYEEALGKDFGKINNSSPLLSILRSLGRFQPKREGDNYVIDEPYDFRGAARAEEGWKMFWGRTTGPTKP